MSAKEIIKEDDLAMFCSVCNEHREDVNEDDVCPDCETINKTAIIFKLNKALTIQLGEDQGYSWENMIDDSGLTEKEAAWAKKYTNYKAYQDRPAHTIDLKGYDMETGEGEFYCSGCKKEIDTISWTNEDEDTFRMEVVEDSKESEGDPLVGLYVRKNFCNGSLEPYCGECQQWVRLNFRWEFM